MQTPDHTCQESCGELSPRRLGTGGTDSTYFEISVSERDEDSRNRESIIELYRSLRPSLHAYLCCLGTSSDQAEDIIQETFLRLVRHRFERGKEESLRGWIFRVAHNLSMDLHRSQRRWSYATEEVNAVVWQRLNPAPNPEQTLIIRERFRRLGGAVGQLTPRQRHCVRLRAEGFRYREIASAMGISVQRVGELVHRAVALLETEA